MNDRVKSPIVFIIFNRPDTTEIVFEKIANVKPKKLFVIADGPRLNVDGEIENCIKTREIIKKINWDCDLKIHYSDVNLGCKNRVVSGLNWVFEMVENAIILEDDCVPSDSFFNYCDDLLEKYKNDHRIMTICGTNLANTDNINSSYYFAQIPHIWGWATWKRTWIEYDQNMNNLTKLMESNEFINKFNNKSEYRFWKNYLNEVANGKVDTWDAQMTYLAFISNRLSVFPRKNLITNIGFGENATHTKAVNITANLKRYEIHENLKEPISFIPNKNAEIERGKKEGIGLNKIEKIKLRTKNKILRIFK